MPETNEDPFPSAQSAEIVNKVGDDDVLLGRGKRSYNHIGNIRFRKIVFDHAHAYQSNDSQSFRKAKELEIMREVERTGGKFLKPADREKANEGSLAGVWHVVPKAAVLTKVKQSLRDVSVSLATNTRPPENSMDIASNDQVPTSIPESVRLVAPNMSAFAQYSFNHQQQPGVPAIAAQATAMLHHALPHQNLQTINDQGLATAMQTLMQRRATEAALFQHWQHQQSATELISLLTQQQLPRMIPATLGLGDQIRPPPASVSLPLLGSVAGGQQHPTHVSFSLPASGGSLEHYLPPANSGAANASWGGQSTIAGNIAEQQHFLSIEDRNERTRKQETSAESSAGSRAKSTTSGDEDSSSPSQDSESDTQHHYMESNRNKQETSAESSSSGARAKSTTSGEEESSSPSQGSSNSESCRKRKRKRSPPTSSTDSDDRF